MSHASTFARRNGDAGRGSEDNARGGVSGGKFMCQTCGKMHLGQCYYCHR